MTINNSISILCELSTHAYESIPLICMGESDLCSLLNMPTILEICPSRELGTYITTQDGVHFFPSSGKVHKLLF